MQAKRTDIRIIITGGGTGGHVFPAIAIADALREKLPGVDVLFVGADNRMEMEQVPRAGYRIRGLPVRGFDRKRILRNFPVAVRLLRSLNMAAGIIREFNPDAVAGVGGYASGPVLRKACRKGIPTLIQEQNSWPGLTNRLLARRVDRICVAYEGMDRCFPPGKIVFTGNPVRKEIAGADLVAIRDEALAHFGLDPARKVLLLLGGSLGSRTMNEAVVAGLSLLEGAGVQLLWQCGRFYIDRLRETLGTTPRSSFRLMDFISRMDLAYAAADLIISRAGAITLSELAHAGRPVILVPSPNVAEDHQTRNAMALARREAAAWIPDREATERLVREALDLLGNGDKSAQLAKNLASMAVEDAASRVAEEIIGILP